MLPDHISAELEGWRLEAWRRMDPRITKKDILDRIPLQYRVGNFSTIQMRVNRFRDACNVLGWISKGRRFGSNLQSLTVRLQQAGINLAANTTRGISWGLVNPSLGAAGGRIPVPQNMRWDCCVEDGPSKAAVVAASAGAPGNIAQAISVIQNTPIISGPRVLPATLIPHAMQARVPEICRNTYSSPLASKFEAVVHAQTHPAPINASHLPNCGRSLPLTTPTIATNNGQTLSTHSASALSSQPPAIASTTHSALKPPYRVSGMSLDPALCTIVDKSGPRGLNKMEQLQNNRRGQFSEMSAPIRPTESTTGLSSSSRPDRDHSALSRHSAVSQSQPGLRRGAPGFSPAEYVVSSPSSKKRKEWSDKDVSEDDDTDNISKRKRQAPDNASAQKRFHDPKFAEFLRQERKKVKCGPQYAGLRGARALEGLRESSHTIHVPQVEAVREQPGHLPQRSFYSTGHDYTVGGPLQGSRSFETAGYTISPYGDSYAYGPPTSEFEEAMWYARPVQYTARAMGCDLPRRGPDPEFVHQDNEDLVYPPLE